MKPPKHPVAVSRASVRLVRELPAERKVGKFLARALSDESFERFQELVLDAALTSLENPLRLLTLPHLCNAVATRIPYLEDASRVLLEGFSLELVSQGKLLRLGTLSRELEPYQALYSSRCQPLVLDSLKSLYEVLCSETAISSQQAAHLLPSELSARNQNVQIALGALVYRGFATTDAAPGVGFETIRLPHVTPQL